MSSECKVEESFSLSDSDITIERDVVSKNNAPIPSPELRGKGLYDLSNCENMNNQNN